VVGKDPVRGLVGRKQEEGVFFAARSDSPGDVIWPNHNPELWERRHWRKLEKKRQVFKRMT
jgi:hypothetical protein